MHAEGEGVFLCAETLCGRSRYVIVVQYISHHHIVVIGPRNACRYIQDALPSG